MAKLFSEILESEDKSEQMKELEKLEDPKEIKAALELLDEKIDRTAKDTLPDGSSQKESEPGKDTSGKEKEEEDGGKEKTGEDEENKFDLNDEFIQSQPEDNRAILEKYKGKSKEDIATAAANAVALKTPFFKENEKAIEFYKNQFLEKGTDELVNILIESQKESGKVEKPAEKKSIEKVEEIKLELPELPDDPEFKKILHKETIKSLKSKYPNLPDVDSMEEEDFKEFARDLNIDEPFNSLRQDIESVQKQIKNDLSKIIYIQNNLPNLYETSPEEIIPLLNEQHLPRLRALNDHPMDVLVQDLGKEVEAIKTNLKKYNLTEKDLGIDFTITRDESGMPFNQTLNDLIMEGKTEDGRAIPSNKIIGTKGKTFWLIPGELQRKFKEEYDDKILTAFVNKKAETDKLTKEKLKKETLNEGRGTMKLGDKRTYTKESIEGENDPVKIKKILADLS